MGDQALGINT